MSKHHGLSKTRLYNIFKNMKQRCYNENDRKYKYYGGKGVGIYQEWLDDFKSFYEWSMANGYDDNLTIDRIDADGDYCPENCRWITLQQNIAKSHGSEWMGEARLDALIKFNKEEYDNTLLKLLQKNGWEIKRIHGSHHILQKDDKKVTIPRHNGDLDIKTVKTILKQAGIE